MRCLLFLISAFFIGCATTKITTEDENAEIFLDDHLMGIGQATVDRVGPPHQGKLEARRDGQIVGAESMSRSFTFKTLLWGLCSYYTGFYWGWYYPESIFIHTMVLNSNVQKVESLWSKPRQSVWMQPLK